MNLKMRENRRRYGITLKDIANKTFVPLDTLRAWEDGDCPAERSSCGMSCGRNDQMRCSRSVFGVTLRS